MRRCQPSRSFTNWSTGNASTNSFATAITGPSGTSSMRSCHDAAVASSACCLARSTGLVSTRCTATAARKSGTARVARSASAISVPRPGPSSTKFTRAGAPIWRHTVAAQAPISSPNIWLISGAVVKSPAAPNGSRVT